MSAIVSREKTIGFDGIRRYRTRCKVRIDSHNAAAGSSGAYEPVWITNGVLAVNCSKTLKGIGQAALTLLPTSNWLNVILPNDYINIYFDIGDGEGWTRTFFGFVDRVEEAYQVAADGKPQTRYHIVCSDFQKAFERTMIYFNPHLAARKDFQASAFAAPNIGGLALATRGIEVGGSPADIVQNVLLITLGFGSQFVLPPSYDAANIRRLRQRRSEFVQGQLSETARQAIENAGGNFEKLREQLRQEADGLAADVAGQYFSEEERINALADSSGLSIGEIESVTENNSFADIFADRRLRELLSPTGESSGRAIGSFSQGSLNILEGTTSDSERNLLDVVDIFTFIERRAIDGFMAGQPVWQKQGSLMSILRSHCHEIMNELFFDLRPLSIDSLEPNFNYETADTDGTTPFEYLRTEDDVHGNAADAGQTSGITYVPAVVMREYPFSTIDGIDLRGVNIGLRTSDGPEEVGIVYFGSIFSDYPNQPGRHVVTIPNINVSDRARGGESLALSVPKHLDVAVVSEQEIISSQLGRSDSDHFNLMEFISDSVLGTHAKFYMHDLLPIVTPIHVIRNGLRVRSITTRFARFSLSVVERTNAPVTSAEVEEVDEEPEEAEEPISEVVAPGDVVAPALGADDVRFINASPGRWGYRQKSRIAAPGTTQEGAWVMHQGIDIVARVSAFLSDPPTILQIPIYCVADGEIVISAPEGAYGGYGDIIVIRHRFDGVEGYRYSIYAHLESRAVGWGISDKAATPRMRPRYSAEGAPGVAAFEHQPIPIRKGTLIGRMGNTGTTSSNRRASNQANRNLFSGVHLHFEIDRVFPPRNDSVTPRFSYVDSGATRFSASRPSPPAGYDRSFDPVEFYQDVHGLDLSVLINQGLSIPDPQEIEDNVEPQDDDRADPVDLQDENRPREDVLEENNAEPLPDAQFQSVIRGSVDTAITRSQVIRWALLQDHWYQHNLEYISGKFVMRGAPEIRVGYRLDVIERAMSFYVEGVNHSWQFPNKLTTSVQVTRGQPNSPYPLYVLPQLEPYNPTDDQRQTAQSRLATYFLVPDTIAVRRAVTLSGGGFDSPTVPNAITQQQDNVDYRVNGIDNTEQDERGVDLTYNEHVIPAGVNPTSVSSILAQEQRAEDLQELEETLTNPRLDTGISEVDGAFGDWTVPDDTTGIS